MSRCFAGSFTNLATVRRMVNLILLFVISLYVSLLVHAVGNDEVLAFSFTAAEVGDGTVLASSRYILRSLQRTTQYKLFLIDVHVRFVLVVHVAACTFFGVSGLGMTTRCASLPLDAQTHMGA